MALTPKLILVAVDLHDARDDALDMAAFYARSFGSAVRVFHAADINVPSPPIPIPGASELRQEALASAENELAAELEKRVRPSMDGIETSYCVARSSSTGEAVCAAARDSGADLVIVGSQGRTGIGRMLLGSVAESVVRHAPCPVLVVRRPPDSPAAASSSS